MAQIDIGKLTFTHKGDYAGGTAYVANDVVYYNGSAYVAKTSTTGNLPTSTAHWNNFAAGSGGIWNAGLSIGSAGQVVKVNSGASALEFGTVSSDYVKLSTIEPSANSTNHVVFDNLFDDTTYLYYVCAWDNVSLHSGSNMGMRFRFLNASGAELTGSLYRGGCMAHYIHGSTSQTHIHRDWNDAELNMFADNISLTADNNRGWTGEIRISQPQSTVHKTQLQGHCTGDDGAGTSIWDSSVGGYYNDGSSGSIVSRGFKIYGTDSYNFAAGSRWSLYGVKK